MKISLLCDMDYSGQTYNIASFLNRNGHNAVLISEKENPYKYSSMIIKTPTNLRQIHKTIKSSDIVIFYETMFHLNKVFSLNEELLYGKLIIVLLGGWGFRTPVYRERDALIYESLNNYSTIKFVSISLDFLDPDWKDNPIWDCKEYRDEGWSDNVPSCMKNMYWIPPFVDVNRLREQYDFSKPQTPLIVTSPSAGTIWQANVATDFNAAIAKLKNKQYNVDIITLVSNDACLKRKAHASIFFDRIFSVYGVNSQEAGSFEAAVVTGSSDFVVRNLQKEFDCPFIFVKNHDELRENIDNLLDNPKFRKFKGKECYQYVKKVHSGKETMNRLIKIIQNEIKIVDLK